jgi:CRP-like cAMP-binding protein
MGSTRRRENRRYIERLATASLFANCTPRELRVIASLCTPVSVRAGRVLTRQGSRGDQCFVVIHGHAVVERDGVIIGHVVDGSVIGELALLSHSTRTATVTAATDMEMLVMSCSEFTALRALGVDTSVRRALDEIAHDRLALLQRPAAPVEELVPAG